MFDELESLLEESLQQKQARKRTIYKEKYSNDLPPLEELVPVDCWRTEYHAAIFIEHICDCGNKTRTFSHFAARQVFSNRCAGKPSQWKKVDKKPEVLAAPRIIQQQVPICSSCYHAHKAIPYHASDLADTQMKLF